MAKTRNELEIILNSQSDVPSISTREERGLSTGAKVGIAALSVVTITVVTLFLMGTIQSLAARWLVSGKAPYALRGILEKLAKMGSIRHRRSKKYYLVQEKNLITPISLIDGLFLYGSLKINGDLRDLYDYDVRREKLTIEFARDSGTFVLTRYESGSWVFVNERDATDVVVAEVPSELEVREMKYFSKEGY